jgi:hypothetical protein
MSNKYSWVKYINMTDLKALIVLFLARCLILDASLGHLIFTSTMSKKRFSFLLRFRSVDDATTRPDRWRLDRFAAIRDIFEEWNENCGKHVNAGDFLTIDEDLYNCRNQWSGKVFNLDKPHPYGINFNCLNEVRFPFIYRSEVFAGKPELDGAGYYEPTTFGLTVRLLAKYGYPKLRGSNLTSDNLYGSIPLAQHLLEKKIIFITTMRANRKGREFYHCLE